MSQTTSDSLDSSNTNSFSSESLPKQFEKTTEVLPFTKYGLSTIEEFIREEKSLQKLESLKKAGLSHEEIHLYKQNEAGTLVGNKKVETRILKCKLETIYKKIQAFVNGSGSSTDPTDKPSKSTSKTNVNKFQQNELKFYPPGHPMHNLRELEADMFGHLTDIMPLTKRRKLLRRLERKKERILSQNKLDVGLINNISKTPRPGSLWDVKELPVKVKQKDMIGPKKPTMYTIKENKIVRLEPVNREREEYEAVEIVVPVNQAEEQLLEGTKMNVDDIRKIERFKDYEPGAPSNVLYLKNISPSVTQDQINILFNQFVLENGGPIDVRLMTGRMRGQAFVSFLTEELSIRALDDVNGTILSGRPIIAQFGRNTNRIQENT